MTPSTYTITYSDDTPGACCGFHLADCCSDDRVAAVSEKMSAAPCDWCDAEEAAQDAVQGNLNA